MSQFYSHFFHSKQHNATTTTRNPNTNSLNTSTETRAIQQLKKRQQQVVGLLDQIELIYETDDDVNNTKTLLLKKKRKQELQVKGLLNQIKLVVQDDDVQLL